MIVVDTNVIAYLFINGDKTEAAEKLYQHDSDWVAPFLWLDEFLNVLCTYERNGLLSAQETKAMMSDALALMDGKSYQVAPDQVLATARRTGCSGYDSQYIALAEELGVNLYTNDKKVLAACPQLAVCPG
jgi:predicted nucleic acid-binding protein